MHGETVKLITRVGFTKSLDIRIRINVCN